MWFFKNMFKKQLIFAQTGYFFVLLALLMHKNAKKIDNKS